MFTKDIKLKIKLKEFMLKDKTLCDFTKSDFEKYKDLLKEITKEPKYICKKCYRASSDKDFLCKPTKL